MRRHSGGTNLGDALDRYLRRADKTGGLGRARIADRWESAAGPEIARHTSGLHLRGKELVVHVDSNVWATELAALSAPLMRSLNESLGQEMVTSMRFTVSRKVEERRSREAQEEEDEAFYSEDKVVTRPLTEAEIEEVRRSTETIGDADLREAVIRTTVKDLEWKRSLQQRDSK